MRRAKPFAAPFSLWLLEVILEGTCAQEAPGFSPLSGLFTAFAANSQARSSGSGFIAVNGQSFTDQSCREFIPIGLLLPILKPFNSYLTAQLGTYLSAGAAVKALIELCILEQVGVHGQT